MSRVPVSDAKGTGVLLDPFGHGIWAGEGVVRLPAIPVFLFAFNFAFTYACIRGAWRGGHHSNPKQGLGSSCSARGASMEGAEM